MMRCEQPKTVTNVGTCGNWTTTVPCEACHGCFLDERDRCVHLAESEPEPIGVMPAENYAAALAESLKTGVGIPEICARAAVRAVRESIAKKIREA